MVAAEQQVSGGNAAEPPETAAEWRHRVVRVHQGAMEAKLVQTAELNAAYYRRRAQETRNLASAMTDASIQMQMRSIAEEYARLAERAEAWERNYPKPLEAEAKG
jgi:hypothetical protein